MNLFIFTALIYCVRKYLGHGHHDIISDPVGDRTMEYKGHHIGNTGLKTLVITEDVLHKRDGKVYTSTNELTHALNNGSAKSLEQQIIEMNAEALRNRKESLAAKQKAAEYLHSLKAVEAEEKAVKLKLLEKQKEDLDKLMKAPKEELVKDIIPTVAVTPHSLGFVEHDRLELQRLNDIRLASLKEGEMQKKNALLHERPYNKSPFESFESNPELIKQFYENSPVNKASAIVDPTKGRFSIINDNHGPIDEPINGYEYYDHHDHYEEPSNHNGTIPGPLGWL